MTGPRHNQAGKAVRGCPFLFQQGRASRELRCPTPRWWANRCGCGRKIALMMLTTSSLESMNAGQPTQRE
jgi:hypothetical protein